ncbi:MAG: HNH endonuclease, partial [Deltaproteobacteria bacterium]|nr:HNH endonuclease [Deltaproteobacteria bacterium]
RLCCDVSVVSADTTKRRLPTTHQRRAMEARDGGCCFPGCTHQRYLEAHHIEHWADGGTTTLSNLTSICAFHHHLLHEGGFGMHREEDGALVFSAPDGTKLPSSPPGLDCEEAIATLREQLAREGVHIDDQSAPLPVGDPLDLGWAVELLLDQQNIGGMS